MVGGFGNTVGDVQEEDAEREEDYDSNLDLLARGAIEDGKQQYRCNHTGKDDIHDIEGVASTYVKFERHERELLIRAAFVREFIPVRCS